MNVTKGILHVMQNAAELKADAHILAESPENSPDNPSSFRIAINTAKMFGFAICPVCILSFIVSSGWLRIELKIPAKKPVIPSNSNGAILNCAKLLLD